MTTLPLAAYVPVIHQGYLELFAKYPDTLYVFGDDVLGLVSYLSRDMRACRPEAIVQMAQGLGYFRSVRLTNIEQLKILATLPGKTAMPDEDISREVARRFFRRDQVELAPVFLRWHQHNAASERDPDANRSVTTEEFHLEFLRHADRQAARSSDWWRQVGACAVRKGKILLSTHNTHFPAEQTPYIVGDPRTPFSWGERIDVSSAGHAERLLIGEAARRGLSLDGADLYTTTFPCPSCAIQVAVAGFKRVYYRDGYSLADADRILREKDVDIIRVAL